MERDFLFDKIHQLVILLQDSTEEIEDREKLLLQTNKKLVPVQRKLMQTIANFIVRLDSALDKYSFGQEIQNNVRQELQTLFSMMLPYKELDDKMADLYDKHHDQSYDDMIEALEKELVQSIASRFADNEVKPLDYDNLPLLEGPTVFDIRNYEREVAKMIIEQNVDENAPEPIDRMYQLSEDERMVCFDESYYLILSGLLSDLRKVKNLEDVREKINNIVTFDKYSTSTEKAKETFIKVVRTALDDMNDLSDEEVAAVIGAMTHFETMLDNEKSTRALFSKYDLVDDFITLEGRDPETKQYKSRYDYLHEAIDLLKQNSAGIERAMKQIRSREDIIVFFSNIEDEE